MKQLVLLAGCVVVLSGLAGCQNPDRSVEVITGSDGQFPEFLVGVWEAEVANSKWGFRFERDGSISKIIHGLAEGVDLKEGGVYLEGPDPGTYAVFTMGPCEAEYDTSRRELKVTIILDYYKMVLPHGELEGRSDDYFRGVVSEDGKSWEADWLSYTWLEGADPPDANAIEAEPVRLEFRKLDIK